MVFLESNLELVRRSDVIFLTVKPGMYKDVIGGIKDLELSGKVFVSVAAGLGLENIKKSFGKDVPIVRSMPNTPSMLGAGMAAICPNELVTEGQLEEVRKIFSSFGRCEIVTEDLFDVVTGVSGSGPAYAYMFIDAMAKAAGKQGMDPEKAIVFAAQSVLGAARMILEGEDEPDVLIDKVCSPGGTTIEAVDEFRKRNLYGMVEDAMKRCIERSAQLGK